MPRNRLTEEFCRGIFIPFVSPARDVSRVTAARYFRDTAGNIDHGCRSATTPVAIMGCLLSPGLKSLNIGNSMDGRKQSFRACSKSAFLHRKCPGSSQGINDVRIIHGVWAKVVWETLGSRPCNPSSSTACKHAGEFAVPVHQLKGDYPESH